MFNGRMEEIQEGEGHHQCYRVHWHDMDFTEVKNVWVQFTWDNKCKLGFGIVVCYACFFTTMCVD